METNEGKTLTVKDYKAMAAAIVKETGCRWSEACLEIKRRYPESLEAFGAPVVRAS